jgi:hypothetical protein
LQADPTGLRIERAAKQKVRGGGGTRGARPVGGQEGETDLSTAQSPPAAHARLPQTHAHPQRQTGTVPAARQGEEALVGLRLEKMHDESRRRRTEGSEGDSTAFQGRSCVSREAGGADSSATRGRSPQGALRCEPACGRCSSSQSRQAFDARSLPRDRSASEIESRTSGLDCARALRAREHARGTGRDAHVARAGELVGHGDRVVVRAPRRESARALQV